jgi:hypothetical protein
MFKKKKAKRRSRGKAALLRRVERIARTAAVLRIRGQVQRAAAYDKKLDGLMDLAEAQRIGGAAFERETRGRQRGGKLYHKVFKRAK